jgi:hypothetical protein
LSKNYNPAPVFSQSPRSAIFSVSIPYLQLAREFGVSINYVIGIVGRNGLFRKRGRGSPAWKHKQAAKQAV